jgi:FlaG/FlaF family flagellin (archaellin)
MVAVTVILAAVIAAYVFGIPSGIQKAKLMGVIGSDGCDRRIHPDIVL